jgi:hypothetical protein
MHLKDGKTPYEKAQELLDLAKKETDPGLRKLRLEAARRYYKMDAPENKIPSWFQPAGFACGVATLGFFMWLAAKNVTEPTFAHQAVIALGMALAAAFIGGDAAAKSEIPFFKNSPIAISASGGIAVFVIVFALVSLKWPINGSGNPAPSASPSVTTSAQGSPFPSRSPAKVGDASATPGPSPLSIAQKLAGGAVAVIKFDESSNELSLIANERYRVWYEPAVLEWHGVGHLRHNAVDSEYKTADEASVTACDRSPNPLHGHHRPDRCCEPPTDRCLLLWGRTLWFSDDGDGTGEIRDAEEGRKIGRIALER